MSRLKHVMVLALLVTSLHGSAAEAVELGVPGHGTLVIPVPSSWSVEPRSVPGPFPSWRLLPPGAAGGRILITAIWGIDPDVSKLRDALRAGAVERAGGVSDKDLPLWEKEGPEARVAWFTLEDPDASNAPEEPTHSLHGLVDVGPLRLTMTVLHHQPDPDLQQAAVTVLAGTRFRPADPHAGDASLKIKERSWELVLPLDGFLVGATMVRVGGGGVSLQAEHPETGVVLSAFIEETDKDWPAERWRTWYQERWKPGRLRYEGVVEGELAGQPVLQYDVTVAGARQFKQRNANMFFVHDGTWIDVHISKAEYQHQEAALLRDLLEAIRLRPSRSGSSSE